MIASDEQEFDALAEAYPEDEAIECDGELEGSEEGDLCANAQDISLERADRSLSELKRWFDEGDLIVNPEWQRNFVWNRKQSSKLIESFLLNIPVPVVYLARTEEDKYEVIDGLQRLKSVFNFFDNIFPLSGMDMLPLNGKRFRDLEASTQRRLRNATLRSFELTHNHGSDIHFIVFERLNTGGTKLNEMEIRNCIYRGTLNDLIKELAEDPAFVQAVNGEALKARMNDRYLVLRFLAFYERTHLRYTLGLKRFLNDFLSAYRYATPQTINEYRQTFQKCIRASRTIFGEQGFRLKSGKFRNSSSVGEWNPRVNAAVFQAVATSFAKYNLGHLVRNADKIYEAYLHLVTTDEKWVNGVGGANQNTDNIKYTFDIWEKQLSMVMEGGSPNDGRRNFSKSLKREMFDQSKECSLCGQEIKLLDDAALDHDIHYWRGGATIPDNARLAHRFCNSSKGGR